MGPPMVTLEADFQRASGNALFGCVSRVVFSMYERNYRTRTETYSAVPWACISQGRAGDIVALRCE